MNVSTSDKTLRLPKTQSSYVKYLENEYDGSCIFCAKKELLPITDIERAAKDWIVVKNKFPYDKIFKNHIMIAPSRHVGDVWELTDDERKQLDMLLDKKKYTMCILNKRESRSIPQHLHYHLVTIK